MPEDGPPATARQLHADVRLLRYCIEREQVRCTLLQCFNVFYFKYLVRQLLPFYLLESWWKQCTFNNVHTWVGCQLR